MDQEPHTQYNNYSVGNKIQNFNQEYWEHISLNRQAVGTISNHQFLQSGVEQREERKTGWNGYDSNNRRGKRQKEHSQIHHEADRVQDTSPQNMAPWHTEYFNLKEVEKQRVQEGLPDLLP